MRLSVRAVILAGGKGTRLVGIDAKPLAPLLGKKLIDYPLTQVLDFFRSENVDGSVSVVTGHKSEDVEKYVKESYPNIPISFSLQEKPLGTGDALNSYFTAHCESSSQYDLTLVLCADTPLLTAQNIKALYEKCLEDQVQGALATFVTPNPYGYGRIIRSESGLSIVEEQEADELQRSVKEVNSGLYLFKTDFVAKKLQGLKPRGDKGEYYLTDVIESGDMVKPILSSDEKCFLGVNNLEQLEEAEKELLNRKVCRLRGKGVRFLMSDTVYIEDDVVIGEGSVIYPNTLFFGKTTIGKGCIIEAGAVVRNSLVGDGTVVKSYSYLDEATVFQDVKIGPFAHLRPKTIAENFVKIGNFVEIKKATLCEGSKVSHLSYVGDAEVGERTNIGCGFITCNYDGAQKHFTKIGKDSFVGSDTQMIAPVEIGDQCFVASGSTIGQSMPSGSFAIARSRQITKEGMAKKFIKNKEEL